MLPQVYYWIGVEAGTSYQWVLADGSGSVGNGQPSNGAPHAHWCASRHMPAALPMYAS